MVENVSKEGKDLLENLKQRNSLIVVLCLLSKTLSIFICNVAPVYDKSPTLCNFYSFLVSSFDEIMIKE